MLTNFIYVPIVKWKQGEQGALKELDDCIKDKIIPLIEITPDFNEKKFETTLNNWVNRYFYFDMFPECYENDNNIYFETLKKCDSDFVIPVLVIDDSDDVIKNAYNYSKNGVAFRITSNNAEDLDYLLENIIEKYDPSNIDLIIDMKSITNKNISEKNIVLKSMLSDIPQINSFRNIILASSSFPETLTDIKKYKPELIDRLEFDLWIKSRKFNRKYDINIIFSDYCINHPSFFEYIPGMSPSFNIRYTTDNSYLILKGDTIKKGGLDPENIIKLCDEVIKSGYYKGDTFSWGDSYIATRCDHSDNCGNLSTWRKVGTNHHITLVVDQLSNLL